ncbi:MAG TPA: hypothetical protein PKD51_13655 [Saprospiraceae bacterium]|nr:hypothetical protein [Saprospiraceae bacterium]
MNWKSNILILTLCLPMLVIWSYFMVKQQMVKNEVEEKRNEGFNKDVVKILTFAKKDIKTIVRWEHDREFEFLGEMYDVISSLESEDSITYTCYWDIEETKIKKQIVKLFFNDNEKLPFQHEKEAKMIEYFKQFYTVGNVQILANNLQQDISVKLLLNNKKFFIMQLFNVVPHPPPEILFLRPQI